MGLLTDTASGRQPTFDQYFRMVTAWALGEIRDPRAEKRLMDALENEEMDIVAGAHLFFIRRGQPGSEETLIKALGHDPSISESLRHCGNPQLELAGQQIGPVFRNDMHLNQEIFPPPPAQPTLWGSGP